MNRNVVVVDLLAGGRRSVKIVAAKHDAATTQAIYGVVEDVVVRAPGKDGEILDDMSGGAYDVVMNGRARTLVGEDTALTATTEVVVENVYRNA